MVPNIFSGIEPRLISIGDHYPNHYATATFLKSFTFQKGFTYIGSGAWKCCDRM